jgi:hypothetical protein
LFLGRRGHFVASHDVKELLAFPALGSVVGLSRIIQVEVSFQPLTEFQVVLVFGFNKFVYLQLIE